MIRMIKVVDQANFRQAALSGKARQLFLLRERGYQVPALCCLKGEELRGLLDESALKSIQTLSAQLGGQSSEALQETSAAIRGMLQQQLETERVAELLSQIIENYFPDTQLFAVRSSAALEDGQQHSFAGQFDTTLSVSREALPGAIARCVGSQYLPNVLSYAQRHGLSLGALEVDVIIQEMVLGERSGILFTANPQGLLNESVVVVGAGTGDHVVEDRTETTSYYYQTTDNQYYYEQQADAPLLNEEELVALVAVGQQLKQDWGQHVDAEFTLVQDQLYLLQVRPITTLAQGREMVLDNSNIVESYPGLTLPLTISFIKQAYSGVFKGLALRCVPDPPFVSQYDGIFKEMLGAVNGRVYYKISHWYTLLSFLPLHKRIIPVWEEMLGITEERPKDAGITLSVGKRLRTYIRLLKEARAIPKGMEQLNQTFAEVEVLFERRFHTNLANGEILALYSELKSQVLSAWDITLLNDLYAFVYTGVLKHQLKRMKIPTYEQLTNDFISGIGNLESMKPILALLQLSQRIIDEGLEDELDQIQTNEQAEACLLQQQSSLGSYAACHIQTYGDRSLEELKLETQTFRAQPLRLFEELRSYVHNPDQLSDLLKKFNVERTQTTISGALTLNSLSAFRLSERQQRKIRRLSSKAQLGIQNRETSRLNRSRLYGMVRSLYTQMGENLAASKQLEQPRDIFYVTLEELDDLEQGRLSGEEVRALVVQRKAAYQSFAQLPAYSRLVFAEKEFNKYPQGVNSVKVTEDKDTLSGIPCSKGVVTGEVLVVKDPHQVGDVSGKILVTKMTDPGWVFLLTKAAGVIAERGSLIYHTAIISRELQIPSIVAVSDATEVLKTGERVTLDGSTGFIKREEGNHVSSR